MKDSNFFDRKTYLEILEKRIGGLKYGYRQNIAIIGDELVGKTSLLYKFLDGFHDNSILMLFLEVRPESLNTFVRRFSAVLLYNFLINSGIELREDLDFLMQKAEKYAPKTILKIRQLLNSVSKRKKNNIFSELFSLPELLNQETGKFCVVIFDEFQNLESFGARELYREWSKVLMTQKNTMHIIVSSLKFKTKLILSKNLSLLFGNFEVITLEPFNIKLSEQYLEKRLDGLHLEKWTSDFIVHFTGGLPFYLEIIASSLKKSQQNNLSEIIENLLFDACGILNQRFSNYIKRFLDSSSSNDYISILYLISSGRNKIKDIVHLLKKQKKDVALRINHLLELDTITRNGDFLKINDRVFGFWVRFVYQEKLHALTFDAKNQKEKFRDNIESMIQEFLLNSDKPILERILEVLRLFADETIQMERKRVRLNHFREIKPLEFVSRNLRTGLIGRSQDSIWIICFKNDLLTEEDIAEFSKECRKYRHKSQRKIILTLGEIDSNTRLRALEEKIWTWDVNNLNQIMDLYSKPRVIA